MPTQAIATEAAPAVMPMPALEPQIIRIKIALQGRERYEFQALQKFYGVSEKRLAVAAIRHFLESVKEKLPTVSTL
jgi:hypothetical protein